MTGVCKLRQELADSAMPLEAAITPLPTRGGEKLVRLLFEPLGWSVQVGPVVGPDAVTISDLYARVRLTGVARLSAFLNHLYVLIPVLGNAKHYWVGEDEIEKLLERGEGWLDQHPAKELIVRRYLRYRGILARAALERQPRFWRSRGPADDLGDPSALSTTQKRISSGFASVLSEANAISPFASSPSVARH
jgi:hypothetical protein